MKKYEKKIADGNNVYTKDEYRLKKGHIKENGYLSELLTNDMNFEYIEIKVLEREIENCGIELQIRENNINYNITVEENEDLINELLSNNNLIRTTNIPLKSKKKLNKYFILNGEKKEIDKEIRIKITEKMKNEIRERDLLIRDENDEYIIKKEANFDYLCFKITSIDLLGKINYEFIPKMKDGKKYFQYHFDQYKKMEKTTIEAKKSRKRKKELMDLGYKKEDVIRKLKEENYLYFNKEKLNKLIKEDITNYEKVEVKSIFINLSTYSAIKTINELLKKGCKIMK